jgi:hypothetical protein
MANRFLPLNNMPVAGLLITALLASGAFAGSPSNKRLSINGKVVDALGRPISGARVTLEGPSGTLMGASLTSGAGFYHLSVATAGEYIIIVEKSGFKHSVIGVTLSETRASSTTVVLEGKQPLTMAVRAARLKAQNDLSRTGASKYTMSENDINNLATGKYTPLNQVLLQMPGVTLDQNQEIHIRGEHLGIQYQMNGILLPLDINTDPTFTHCSTRFSSKM